MDIKKQRYKKKYSKKLMEKNFFNKTKKYYFVMCPFISQLPKLQQYFLEIKVINIL